MRYWRTAAALLGRDGSIDWLCWPRFDSAACFAALLGEPATDPHMSSTIDAIHTELDDDGLIRRWSRGGDAPDEGAFLACSCWMADCLYLRGDEEAACRQFERVLAVANDLGLLSEEYDARDKCLIGNFPRVLSHLAVVKTALLLSGTAQGHRRTKEGHGRGTGQTQRKT